MIGAIRSEIRKVFTTRLWWGMGLGMAVLAALISMGFAALLGNAAMTGGDNNGQGNPFANMTVGTAQLIYNAGIIQQMTILFPLALGVLLITSEYRHKTISATFLSTPNRWVVLLSKMVAVAVTGALYAVVHAIASVAGGASIIKFVKNQPTMLGETEVWKSLGIGLIAFAIWMLFGFGVGMLIRNQIAAVLLAVGATFVVQIALNIIFSVKEWYSAMKWIPGNLTANMVITSDPTAGQTVDPATQSQYFAHWWQAGLVLAAYAAVLAVVGAWLTTRRDVA
ncbi:ABC transporter permease [Nostocoides australiense]|uniref:Putative ABC transport system membrane protein n=1 Tax=Nostocoides australiense Ben110 TaxID=1193182 RepID=W6JVT4_9MICO|nr:ABC transporter permease subunit [Tetrasphaera australiensis]CCH73157.1 putative ABC transport system membrane protein [Tetrasphaera australiensis Ben110]